MHFSSLLFSSLALATLHVSALQVVKRDLLETLLSRQTASGPCDATCAPFQTSIATCATAACVCTNAVAGSLQTCVNCAISSAPGVASVVSSAQTLVDAYEEGCASFPIQTVTVPGATSASATAPPKSGSAAASSTSTGPLVTTISNDIPFPSASSLSQIVVRPSSTSSNTSPPATSSSGNPSIPGLVNAASRDGMAKAVVMMLSAALGMALVL